MSTSLNDGYSKPISRQDQVRHGGFYENAWTTLGCLRCFTLPRPPHVQRGPESPSPVSGGRVCDELVATARPQQGAAPSGTVAGAGSAESALVTAAPAAAPRQTRQTARRVLRQREVPGDRAGGDGPLLGAAEG